MLWPSSQGSAQKTGLGACSWRLRRELKRQKAPSVRIYMQVAFTDLNTNLSPKDGVTE